MKYNPALDGVRALAVVMVLIFHVSQHLPIPEGGGALKLFRIASMGWSGVDLFFVLSGYLITTILLSARTGQLKQYCTAFYARRALRIFPLYFMVVPAVLVLLHLFGSTKPAWQDWLVQLTYTQNTLGLFLASRVGPFLGHTWSLAVEEWFYLTWPFFVYFLSPRGLRRAALLGILIILTIRLAAQHPGLEVPASASAIMRFDTLLVGALLALSPPTRLSRRLWIGAGVLAFGISVVARLRTEDLSWVAQFNAGVGYTLIAFAAAALVATCLDQQNSTSRLFSWRPAQRVGKVSYGIYLLHLPVLAVLAVYINPLTLSFGYATRFLLLIVPAAIVTCSLAFISYEHFEKRMLDFKSQFDYRHAQDEPAPAAATTAPLGTSPMLSGKR